MTTYPDRDLFKKDGSLDTGKAMEAGHDARSAAIKEFGILFSSAVSAATKLFELRKV